MTKEHIEHIRNYFRRNRNAANIYPSANADEMLELCDLAEKALSPEGVPSTLLRDAADSRFSDSLIGLRFRAWLGVLL